MDKGPESKVVLEFTKQPRRKAPTDYCFDCEWSGKIVARDGQRKTYLFRCYCAKGNQFQSLPVYDRNRLGFREAKAAT